MKTPGRGSQRYTRLQPVAVSLAQADQRKDLVGELPRLVKGGRTAGRLVVADEHSWLLVIRQSHQVRVEILLLRAPLAEQLRRLVRKVHPMLDAEAALVLAQPHVGVPVAGLAPRLTGDRCR